MSGIFGAQEGAEQNFKIKEYFNIFLSPISQFTLQPITLLNSYNPQLPQFQAWKK
jgi:hypothetical protein